MSFFSSIFKRKAPQRRRVVSAPTLAMLLNRAVEGLTGPRHALRLSDKQIASVTRREVETVAAKAWKPWVQEIADCDDQALALVVACREAAYAEGGHVPWGVGFIFTAGEHPHAYTWALTEDKDGDLAIEFYDQTAGRWVRRDELDTPITLTLG